MPFVGQSFLENNSLLSSSSSTVRWISLLQLDGEVYVIFSGKRPKSADANNDKIAWK